MRLSPHFTLEELTTTAIRGVDNTPTEEHQKNLVFLATRVLEPARTMFGPLHTNSAYRSPAINKVVGGNPHSYHMQGCAWDGFPTLDISWKNLIAYLHGREDLPIDQVIYEFGRWIHIGTRPEGKNCRREFLMIFEPGKYEQWNPNDPRVTN